MTMIDSIIFDAKGAHLTWLVGRLNQIKRHVLAEFHPYFLKDLLRELINGVSDSDRKIDPIRKDYQEEMQFLRANGVVCATDNDDREFDRRVAELMGRLRLAS